MADDDQTPLDPEADPIEDDEQPEAEETAEADDQPGSDQGAQEQDQADYIAQLEREVALFRGQAAQGGDEDADADPAASADEYLSRATQDSWTLAETIHGKEAMDAYRVAFRLYERAQTPADYVTAFEAYHAVRSGKLAASADGKGKAGKSRDQAIQPRVDANRSDPGSDPDIETKLSEARKQGSLSSFTSAAAAAMGFGPSKR